VPDPRFSLQIDPLFAGDALHRIVRVARRHAPGLRVSFEGNVYYVTHAPLPEAVEMRLEVGETTLTARTASGGSVGVTALDGDRRVAAVLAPRVLPDGRIEIAVEVVVGSGDAAQRLKSLTVVPAGVPREIGRVTVAGQDVPVRLRVSPLSAEE